MSQRNAMLQVQQFLTDNYCESNSSPGTDIKASDPVVIGSQLEDARRLQDSLGEYLQVDETLSEEENTKLHQEHANLLRKIIRFQMGCIFKLRKTSSTGPAARGGKRAKKAPLDLESTLNI